MHFARPGSWMPPQHADDATGTASVGLDTFAPPSRHPIETFSIIINDDGDGEGERDPTARRGRRMRTRTTADRPDVCLRPLPCRRRRCRSGAQRIGGGIKDVLNSIVEKLQKGIGDRTRTRRAFFAGGLPMRLLVDPRLEEHFVF